MGKHSSEKTKINKFNILLVILLIIGVCGLIILLINKNFFRDENDVTSAEVTKVIDTTFLALKESNIEEVKKHMNYEQLISCLDESILYDEEGKEVSNIEKNLFNTMNWSVESININENEAKVIVEVTNKNFKNIISNWLEKLIEKKEEELISNEECLKILEDVLTKNNVEEKTVIKKITLKKQDEEWKITVNGNLRDLVFSGIESVVNEMKN